MYPSHSHAHLPPIVSLRPVPALRSVVLFSSWYEYDQFERIHGRLRVKVGGAIHVSGRRLLGIFHVITKELVNQRHHPASSLDLSHLDKPASLSQSLRQVQSTLLKNLCSQLPTFAALRAPPSAPLAAFLCCGTCSQ